jgi:hypothetical protein
MMSFSRKVQVPPTLARALCSTARRAAAAPRRPVVLAILDGWGYRETPADNAVLLADTPNFGEDDEVDGW